MSKGSGQTPRVPASRFNIDVHLHADNERPGSFDVAGGYFLNETLQEFDPGAFGITPVEAMWMDPQQRKLLEVVYECFETTGATLSGFAGSSTAVFAACFTTDIQQMAFREPAFRHALAATGVDPGLLSNCISHVFDLRGPSVLVNAACSSSVHALHQACGVLHGGECAGAVVAGVNLVLAVDQHMNMAKLGVLSPTSACHTFDAAANDYGCAEAVGAVYLRRLADPVRAVVRASATNSNGRVPGAGITHPSRDGQVAVMREAYRRGGDLDPQLTGYLECHGTGTAVGDPLEVQAMSLAMGARRRPGDAPLLVGVVKPDVGHSEAASGLSALIKAVLAVERGVVPPTRGVAALSPVIRWAEWGVAVARDPGLFPRGLPVRRVGINSFSYGGTNAHIVVEGADSLLARRQAYRYHGGRAPERVRGAVGRGRPHLLLVSAHDGAALRRNYAALGAVAARYDLLDLAHTLGFRRSALPRRGYAVATAAGVAGAGGLPELAAGAERSPEERPAIGFVFAGQGAQWARMGAELLTYYRSFQHSVRALDRALGELADAPDWTLEDALLLPAGASPIDEAEYA